MAKSFRIGPLSTDSQRTADPNYVRRPTNGPVPKIFIPPGCEQNKAPTISDDPLPPLPMQRVAPPWRFR